MPGLRAVPPLIKNTPTKNYMMPRSHRHPNKNRRPFSHKVEKVEDYVTFTISSFTL